MLRSYCIKALELWRKCTCLYFCTLLFPFASCFGLHFSSFLFFKYTHIQFLRSSTILDSSGGRGGHTRFSLLDSVLLIATDAWKLGNHAAERLLASPAFPHSHFQRFQRVRSADWWWRIAGARGNRVSLPPLYHSLSFSFCFQWVSHGTPAIAIYCRDRLDVLRSSSVLHACLHTG